MRLLADGLSKKINVPVVVLNKPGAGGASGSWVAISLFERALGFKVTRVPYAGYAPTVTALMSGELDTASVPIPDVIEQHRSGKLRLLGVAAAERHFLALEVPIFREQGFDLVAGSWRCVIGPKGIPEDRLRFLTNSVLDVLKDPEFVAGEAGRVRLATGRRQGHRGTLEAR